jgi:tRNA pseudouridine38-40 synthase
MSFSGNGFLYKMVRLLVGAAVRVAEGREDIKWIKEMLQDPGKNKCQYCAKPDGLYLVKVSY